MHASICVRILFSIHTLKTARKKSCRASRVYSIMSQALPGRPLVVERKAGNSWRLLSQPSRCDRRQMRARWTRISLQQLHSETVIGDVSEVL